MAQASTTKWPTSSSLAASLSWCSSRSSQTTSNGVGPPLTPFPQTQHHPPADPLIEYHEAKKSYQQTAKPPPPFHRSDLDRGFNTLSMWSYSRHPNFAAEQSVWVLLYLWGAFITKGWLNWTIVGPISYLALFQGSTWYTEKLSAAKYPDYAEYQKRVGMFLPWPSMGAPGDFSDRMVEEKKEN